MTLAFGAILYILGNMHGPDHESPERTESTIHDALNSVRKGKRGNAENEVLQ